MMLDDPMPKVKPPQPVKAHQQQLVDTLARIQSQVELNLNVQRTLLGEEVHPTPPGLSLTVATLPADVITGNFYTFQQPLSTLFDIAIGKGTATGLPNVLVGTLVKAHLYHLAQPLVHIKYFNKHSLWHEDLLTPCEMITHLHRQLAQPFIQLDFLASLVYGRFDLSKRLFTYVNCGSLPLIYYNATTQQAHLLTDAASSLGATSCCHYVQKQLLFAKDDLFLFCSSAVIGMTTPQGQTVDYPYLITLLQNDAATAPQKLLAYLQTAVKPCTDDKSQADTLLFILVKIDHIPAISTTKSGLTAKFQSHLSQLKAVRIFIAKICQQAPGDTLFLTNQLQLVVTELFTNIVRHGYGGLTGGIMTVQAELTAEGIAVEIWDQGVSFDPSAIEEPNLTGQQENGFGWYIIKAICDEIRYLPKRDHNDWNRIHLFIKYLTHEENMEINYRREGAVLIVQPLGDSLDAKEARLFKEKIIEYINQDGATTLILDLHTINYIDSSGLGSLLSILKFLHTRSGDLKLAALNKPVKTIFELVAMHKIFEIYNTTDEALKAHLAT